MNAPGAPRNWRAAWPILRARIRPYHAWICLSGFVMSLIVTLIAVATLATSLWINPQLAIDRWHEPVLILLLLFAVDLFWFTVWRIYRQIAAENQAGRTD